METVAAIAEERVIVFFRRGRKTGGSKNRTKTVRRSEATINPETGAGSEAEQRQFEPTSTLNPSRQITMRHLATTLAAVLAAAPAESRLGISPSLAERDAASPRAGGFAVRRDLRDLRERAAGRSFPFAPEFLDATGTHAPVGHRNETAPADGGEEDRRRRDLEEAATFGEFEVRRELHEYRFGRTFPLNPDFLHSEAITTTTTTTVPNIPTTQFATFGTVASQAGGGATGADETKANVEKKKKTKKEKEAADLTKQNKKKQKKKALEEEKVEDSTRRGRQLGNQVSEAIQNIIKLSAR